MKTFKQRLALLMTMLVITTSCIQPGMTLAATPPGETVENTESGPKAADTLETEASENEDAPAEDAEGENKDNTGADNGPEDKDNAGTTDNAEDKSEADATTGNDAKNKSESNIENGAEGKNDSTTGNDIEDKSGSKTEDNIEKDDEGEAGDGIITKDEPKKENVTDTVTGEDVSDNQERLHNEKNNAEEKTDGSNTDSPEIISKTEDDPADDNEPVNDPLPEDEILDEDAILDNDLETASPSNAQQPSLMSLLKPEKRTRAKLYLNRLTDEELSAVSLRQILEGMVDTSNRPIFTDEGITKMETDGTTKFLINLFENDDSLSEDYNLTELDDTLDLTEFRTGSSRSYFTMELVIGTGKQLDYHAKSYKIEIYMRNSAYEDFSYTLTNSNGSSVKSISIEEVRSEILGDTEIPVTEVIDYINPADYQPDGTYKLSIRSNMDSQCENNEYQNYDVEAYRMRDFLEVYRKEKTITEITPISLLYYSGRESYESSFSVPDTENPSEADNLFCIVYLDNINPQEPEVIGYEGILFEVQPNASLSSLPSGTIYRYENGGMAVANDSSQTYSRFTSTSSVYRNIDFTQKPNCAVLDYNDYSSSTRGYIYYYALSGQGNTVDKSYYYIMTPDSELQDRIAKIAAGYYSTADRAQKAEDIKEQVCPSSTEQPPYGYPLPAPDSEDSSYIYQTFTLVLTDGSVFPFRISVSLDREQKPTVGIPYEEGPLVNKRDPWFNVTSAILHDSSNVAGAYHVENTANVTYDTLYGYGYQTVFLYDSTADLSSLKPVFEKSDNTTVQKDGTILVSKETIQDFTKSGGTLLYPAWIDDNLRNYQVTFVKGHTGGPKLYVNYPAQDYDQDPEKRENKREIFLTDYFENRHDILIANIGDAMLTGLNVKLENPQNVVLDDYWQVGGNGNDTLHGMGFTGKPTGNENFLAKIRLLPDPKGDGGEISGTLVISANGQKEVRIKLTGYASNPKIITDKLDDAVLYVPYSYVVATNNMYDWAKVTFTLESGRLPAGVELNPNTGEIYGIPRQTGTYTFKVSASFDRDGGESIPEFKASAQTLTLTVKDNSNDNVWNESDANYEVKTTIGTDVNNNHDFTIPPTNRDRDFTSFGPLDEFIDVWLNGQKLTEGTDYVKSEGSTRVTVKSQTFRDKAKRDGSINTIAMEFRQKSTNSANGGDIQGKGAGQVNDMKRTAQNFRITSSAKAESGISDDSSDDSSVDPVSTLSDDAWSQTANGWRCQLPNGTYAANVWMQLIYHGTTEWYRFNAEGYMLTGWYTDSDGRRYYLNPNSDGSQGKMVTGWQFIDGNWYYFNEKSDGTKGALMINTWIGDYYVDPDGIWRG